MQDSPTEISLSSDDDYKPKPMSSKDRMTMIVMGAIIILVIMIVAYLIYMLNQNSSSNKTAATTTPTAKATATPTPTPTLTLTQEEANWSATAGILTSTVTGSVRSNYADSAVYTLPDGSFRLYYQEFNGKPSDYGAVETTPNIESATSTDGTTWKPDTGIRIPNCIPYKQHVEKASDGKLRLYTSCGIYESSDGLTFTKVGNANIPNATGFAAFGPVDVVKLSDGSYRAYRAFDYGSSTNTAQQTVKVFSYTSQNGLTFKQEETTPIVSDCVTVGSDSYKVRDTLMVEPGTTSNWVMYIATDASCPQTTVPIGQTAPSLQPVVVIGTSSDGITWTFQTATKLFGAEPYETISKNNQTTMLFGYCYNPNGPKGISASALNALYTQYDGCSIFDAVLPSSTY
jgi:hypothetical protein